MAHLFVSRSAHSPLRFHALSVVVRNQPISVRTRRHKGHWQQYARHRSDGPEPECIQHIPCIRTARGCKNRCSGAGTPRFQRTFLAASAVWEVMCAILAVGCGKMQPPKGKSGKKICCSCPETKKVRVVVGRACLGGEIVLRKSHRNALGGYDAAGEG